jgi:hypothetical protein
MTTPLMDDLCGSRWERSVMPPITSKICTLRISYWPHAALGAELTHSLLNELGRVLRSHQERVAVSTYSMLHWEVSEFLQFCSEYMDQCVKLC